MTLIASLFKPPHLIAVGDALLTTRSRVFEDNPIPTQRLPNETDQVIDTVRFVAGLVRKIFRVGPAIVVGWSGELADFEVAFRHLLANAPDEPLAFADLNALKEKAALPKKTDCCWFMQALTTDRGFVAFRHNVQTPTYPGNVSAMLGGSGRKDFDEVLQWRMLPDVGADQFFFEVISVCAQYLLAQHRQGHGLAEGFGGAIELISAKEGGFAEIDKVLFVFRDFWSEDEAGDVRPDVTNVTKTGETFSKIETAYYQTYHEGSLLVARWHPGGPDLFEIPTPYADPTGPIGPKAGVDLVVECLLHHSGKKPPLLMFPSGKPGAVQYDFKAGEESIKLKMPQAMPSDWEEQLQRTLRGDDKTARYLRF
ncbi:hypothetical protein [Mesorhizobium sp. M00.F.Ca.ET.216.01.1.1]|uniref:hypothetical protein n=1 Tax=Mesorhizobium sp. M00.F.Ca.ET.216.01.1.1 TaxID=2500528 RepID=UPI000FD976F9|nr:hypothetical protein [Mesorhizobium sp. M00.F.Ca.ET.216.01.1.1]TGQ28287.1 hypothetical protein EN859_034680 [Mesorhizobium sp. M00.F.Ca.ET.216.01.1.1]